MGSEYNNNIINLNNNNNTNIMNNEERSNPDYLAQLLREKRQMQPFSAAFMHLERVLDEEISRVRQCLFHASTNTEPLQLPESLGPTVILTEKLYVPAKEYPDFNFVGRILGPRGMTAKQLEQDTGCKIMVRGKGSTRDKRKEDQNRSKTNWEHLSDDLHVLITVEDTKNRAAIKMKRAIEEVKKLLVPSPEGEDDLKKLQLMELAIMNGTYRDNKPPQLLTPPPCLPPGGMMTTGPTLMLPPQLLHSPAGPAGAPIILAPRIQQIYASIPSPGTHGPGGMQISGPAPPLISPVGEPTGTIFYQLDQYFTAGPAPIFDYEHHRNALDHHIAVSMPYVR